MNKKIVVTGAAGYIGSALCRKLLSHGYEVTAIDNLRFGGESLLEIFNNPKFHVLNEDIRNEKKMRKIMKGHDAIVNLAAIVGDPACKKEPELAKEINLSAPIVLYKIANELKIKKFLFASTCSNYGKMEDSTKFIDEGVTLSPVSLYAQTKVEFEKFLLSQPKSNKCKPTCMRFSTVYGLSPRIRLDLTVNDFTKEIKSGRKLLVFGEQFWRPYCHVNDITDAILLILESPTYKVSFEVFNIGNTKENYTKKMIVNEILKQFPDGVVEYIKKEEDPRDYKVSFEKINKVLGFKTKYTVPDGIKEIIKLLGLGLIKNPDDKKYYNT